MILSSVFASSLLAYTANAFLLPLEIADKVEQSQAPNGAPSIFNHNSQTVNIDCSSCPFALASSRNGLPKWTSGVKNDLILDLSAKDDELLLNGQHIYPLNTKAIPTPIKIKQVKQPDGSSENSRLDDDLSLSYSVALSPERQYTGPGQNEFGLVDLTLTLLGLDGQMITVDDLNVKLIKAAKGKLHIARIDKVAPSPNDPSAKCHNMLCKALTKFLTKVAAARQEAFHKATKAAHKVKCFCVRCMHHMAHMVKPTGQNGATGVRLPTHHKVHPEDLLQNAHTKTHSIMRKVMHGFRTFVRLFVIPTFIGAAVGFTASALGMAVGQLIVVLWTKFRRGGNHAYERVETDEKEDLPPYEEVGILEILNEKEDIEKA